MPEPCVSRYRCLYWQSAPLYGGPGGVGDGPFIDWLNTHAPQGYRLVQTFVVQKLTIDRPEIRECLFEAASELVLVEKWWDAAADASVAPATSTVTRFDDSTPADPEVAR